ncbi:MAG: hypothetical protein OXG15_07365 [Gammaproteobacteria bacterium]|nr:hypothetical protein [Gammaproteobacteria bacterium]
MNYRQWAKDKVDILDHISSGNYAEAYVLLSLLESKNLYIRGQISGMMTVLEMIGHRAQDLG